MFGRLSDWLARQLAGKGRWECPNADPAWGYRARQIIERVRQVSGDRRGHLQAGGHIWLCDQAGMQAVRKSRPGWLTAGACEPGTIWLLQGQSPEASALAHEAAHLGLRAWSGGIWGGVAFPSEQECDACAREALQ